MRIERLKIHNLRSFSQVTLQPISSFNLFCGENGSGKTTLLEAIYLLGFGRSFRANQLNSLIRYDQESFASFVEISSNSGQNYVVGLEKYRQKKINLRINGEKGQSIAQLSALLPIQIISPESFQLLSAGPQERRKFIDWCVFHVEPSFIQVWQKYQRALLQRNACLKARSRTRSTIQIWDEELSTYGEQLSLLREQAVDKLLIIIVDLLKTLLSVENVKITYSKGWGEGTLKKALIDSITTDERLGYTKVGPHRADLQVLINGIPAVQILSRGQQKLLITGLILSQGKLLSQRAGKSCIYLVDDLVSELDQFYRRLVIELMASTNSQVFITGIEKALLLESTDGFEHTMFHVEHGIRS